MPTVDAKQQWWYHFVSLLTLLIAQPLVAAPQNAPGRRRDTENDIYLHNAGFAGEKKYILFNLAPGDGYSGCTASTNITTWVKILAHVRDTVLDGNSDEKSSTRVGKVS